jgi:hypothetical protein
MEAIHRLSWKAGFEDSNLALRIGQAKARFDKDREPAQTIPVVLRPPTYAVEIVEE